MVSNFTLFIAAFFLWFLCSILFFSGATVQKVGCETLEEPESAQLGQAFSQEIDETIHENLNDSKFDNVSWSIPEILQK